MVDTRLEPQLLIQDGVRAPAPGDLSGRVDVPGESSAYAAVIVAQDGQKRVTRASIRVSGNNYKAEMTAILAGILSCPAQADLDVYSDCLGAIQAIVRHQSPQLAALSERMEVQKSRSEAERIRAGSRPILTTIRKLLDARTGVVSFQHVKSHTRRTDVHSRGNAMADKEANEQRRMGRHGHYPRFAWNEERIIATLCGDYVHGDFRVWAKRRAAIIRRQQWARSKSHASDLMKNCQDAVAPLCAIVRATGDPQQILLLLEGLCSRAPCGNRHSRERNGPAWPEGIWGCPSCDEPGPERTRHIVQCSGTSAIWLAALQKIQTAVLKKPPVPMATVEAGPGGSSGDEEPHLSTLLKDVRHVYSVRKDIVADSSVCSDTETSWGGTFLLVRASPSGLRQAVRNATVSIEVYRPTRIVIVAPLMPGWLKQRHACECVAWGDTTMVMIFQNELAEAVAQSRQSGPALWLKHGLRCKRQSRHRQPWPKPPLSAWNLVRTNRPDPATLRSGGWLNSISDHPIPPSQCTDDVRLAWGELQAIPIAGRRLGLIPASYRVVLKQAIKETGGPPPTLKELDGMMNDIRGILWNSAFQAFKAAHRARVWVYEADPDNNIAKLEGDRLAQRLFERDKQMRTRPPQSEPGPTPTRHSHRRRSRPKYVGYVVNWEDQYVQALDERKENPLYPLQRRLARLRALV